MEISKVESTGRSKGQRRELENIGRRAVQVCMPSTLQSGDAVLGYWVFGIWGWGKGGGAKCMLNTVVQSVDKLAFNSVHKTAAHSRTTVLKREWLKALDLFGISQPLLQSER